MKVIKYGSIPGESIWSGQCFICHSIIEAKEKEFSMIYPSKPGMPEYAKARCLVCQQTMIFYKGAAK